MIAILLLLLASASEQEEKPPAPHPSPPVRPTGIVLHHTALPIRDRTGRDQAARLARLHDDGRHATRFRGQRYTTGYHYLILRDGVVLVTRPEGCPGRHTRNRPDLLGIAFVGDFSAGRGAGENTASPTLAQFQAGVALCRRLMARYGWSGDRVRLHSQLSSTACPGAGFPWRAFRRRLDGGGGSGPRIHPRPNVVE